MNGTVQPVTNVEACERLGWAAQRATVAAERAAWPDRYVTVRDAIARGFVPFAYGGAPPPAIFRPPTKFAYPAGGLAHPHHADGPEAGSRFWVWSYTDGSPDELRDRPVWFAGDTQPCPLYVYKTLSGLTFDRALDACIAYAEHFVADFVVPTWEGGRPELTAGDWRRVLELTEPPPPSGQLALFATEEPERDHRYRARRAILARLGDAFGGDVLWLDFAPSELYDVELLIDSANWRIGDAGVPAPPVLE